MLAGRSFIGSDIGSFLRHHRPAIVQVAVISAVLNILMLGGSFFMLLVYDEVLPSRSVPTLVGLLIMITMVYIFQSLLDLIRARAMIQVGATVDQQLANRVFDVITRHELRLGPLREGMQPMRDLDQIRGFLSGAGPLAVLDLPWVLLFLGILYMFHVVLGLLATAGVIILVLLTFITDKLTRPPTEHVTSVASARYALADASRRNAEVLYALGMAGRARTSWNEVSDRHLAAYDGLAEVSGGMQSVSKTFRMLLQSLMLAAGAALVINDAASGGIIIAGSILSSRALAPVEQAIANWRGFVATRQAWARLNALLIRIPADRPVMSLPAPKASLVVESLSAAPPGVQKLTVGDVAFKLEAGDVLGVVGPSGSGKTSLLRALVGVWQPLRGSVRLDGATMDQWAADDIGRHIGFMPQDVELFDGTVAQNIARFEPDASNEDILAAARAADVHDLIVRLPQGYDSPLGANGSNLSAGQRQRIALARALYREPFLIVLDEPNSNLDTEGEAALASAIEGAAKRGAIVILVAHRPSALAGANRILYMVEGRMRLFGPREEVLAKLTGRVQQLPKAV
jgi:ATP-binding cassette subfamily C protein